MNTAHYQLQFDNNVANLVFLGVGPDTEEVANKLSEARMAQASLQGKSMELMGPILNIDDLYRLITQATAALNHLPTEELMKP